MNIDIVRCIHDTIFVADLPHKIMFITIFVHHHPCDDHDWINYITQIPLRLQDYY